MFRIASLALLAVASTPSFAQYPDRPVTFLAGFPPGGLVDTVTRVMAEGMKAKFPKGLNVVNKPGVAGAVAVEELLRAKPDGYTIILAPQSSLVIAPQLHPQLNFKTPDDYDPVINTVAYYPLIVVNADAPWKTIQEFVADARANPGKMRIGTPGEGSASQLSVEEFIFRTGTKMTPVPFLGWGQSSPALLGGHIEAVVAQPGEAKPLVDGKRMRVLVVFQEKRHPAFPDAPTAKEAGWDIVNGVWYLIVVPKGTPAPVVKYIHDAAKAVVDSPEFAKTMDARGVDVDNREGEALRADLWTNYKVNTEILKRIGLVK
jgi:tripartite-type tricarboxylate transporter receptor subunit TctC